MLNYESLICTLPEDVLKRRWAGDFEGEIELIDELLKKEIPQLMKDRLLVERKTALRLPKEYRITHEEALRKMQETFSDFREEELDQLELQRAVEYIYVKGQKQYLHSFIDTLIKVYPEWSKRAGEEVFCARPRLDRIIARMKAQGTVKARFHICGELKIQDDVFVKNAPTTVYLPLPKLCAQQSEIEINSDCTQESSESAYQRTAMFKRMSESNDPYVVDYAYTTKMIYVDPLMKAESKEPIYPNEQPVMPEDLQQQLPHIAFTPYLKALAEEIVGDEREPAKKAWKIYEYITTQVKYAFMRSYALIENQAEYCAVNGKGDCGIQALLFITLCRICGIPARWQSGLEVSEHTCGCHDWAQFYVEPYGWLFCDPSYGGSAYRAGAEERWKFYFGNLDPYRMVSTSRYQSTFEPAEQFTRYDPYDNQDGEASINDCGLIYGEFRTKYQVLSIDLT